MNRGRHGAPTAHASSVAAVDSVWPGSRVFLDMRLMKVDSGRWRIDFGDGLGLEVILLFSRTVAFWWWSGRLVAEMTVGEA